VLDEDGMFERRCNLSMVELEPIEAEDDAMIDRHHQRGDLESHGLVDVRSDLTRFDGERLRQLVENQARYTGSTRARAILDDWEGYLPKFRKVMPTEYRRALRELAEQKAAEDQIAAAGE
jgi:glutamate synthase (NADPH/NADH) large chain